MKAREVIAENFVDNTLIVIDDYMFLLRKHIRRSYHVGDDEYYFVMADTVTIPYGQRYIRRTDEGYFAVATVDEWLRFFQNGDYVIDPVRKQHVESEEV